MSKFQKQDNHNAHEDIKKLNGDEEFENTEYPEDNAAFDGAIRADETVVAASGFAKWFWGTIIVLALITLVLSVIQVFRQSSDSNVTLEIMQQRNGAHDISATQLRDELSKSKASAVDAVLLKVQQELDQAYQPVYEAISEYADFHYSLKGEYTELTLATFGNPAEKLQSILFDELDERLEDMHSELDHTFNKAFKAELAELFLREENTNGEFGELTRRVIDDVNTRIIYTAPIGSAAIGGVALTAVAKAMSKKLAAKVAAKAVAKSGGKLASTLTGLGAAALVCGPAAAVCGVAGGAVAWFATDYGILVVDESWNREEFENDLSLMVDEMKEAYRRKVEEALFVRASATEEMNSTVVEHHDFTLRELSGVGSKKICSIASAMNSEYELISSNIEARKPEVLDSLREAATAYEGHVAIGRLAGEIKKNLIKAEQVKAIQFEISGKLPKDYRAERETSGLLVVNGEQFQVDKMETIAESGFSFTSSISTELNFNKPVLYDIAFEQHLRVKSNRYFSGSGKVDHLAEVGTSEGLNMSLELLIPITRFSSSSLQQIVAAKTTENGWVMLTLKLKADALPPLDVRPAACN